MINTLRCVEPQGPTDSGATALKRGQTMNNSIQVKRPHQHGAGWFVAHSARRPHLLDARLPRCLLRRQLRWTPAMDLRLLAGRRSQTPAKVRRGSRGQQTRTSPRARGWRAQPAPQHVPASDQNVTEAPRPCQSVGGVQRLLPPAVPLILLRRIRSLSILAVACW